MIYCGQCSKEYTSKVWLAKHIAAEHPKPLKMLEIYWLWHEGGGADPFARRRVWRSDWFGDQFEIVNTQQFVEIQTFCRLFSIRLTEQGE